jgi:hypothetical protein
MSQRNLKLSLGLRASYLYWNDLYCSMQEKDLHTKRTLHTEFSDKTAEAAKPIVLESPNVGASTSGNVSEANPARKCSTYRVCCNGKEASWEYLSKLRIAVVS